jgi:hypothetical protein
MNMVTFLLIGSATAQFNRRLGGHSSSTRRAIIATQSHAIQTTGPLAVGVEIAAVLVVREGGVQLVSRLTAGRLTQDTGV